MAGTAHDERLEKNQAACREVNERIKEVGAAFVAYDDAPLDFICECARPDCTEPVRIGVGEYERVRASPSRFLLALGHHVDEHATRIVEETDRYRVVERIEEPDPVSPGR